MLVIELLDGIGDAPEAGLRRILAQRRVSKQPANPKALGRLPV